MALRLTNHIVVPWITVENRGSSLKKVIGAVDDPTPETEVKGPDMDETVDDGKVVTDTDTTVDAKTSTTASKTVTPPLKTVTETTKVKGKGKKGKMRGGKNQGEA